MELRFQISNFKFALLAALVLIAGCSSKPAEEEVVVYCSVDEPYASKIFADFEKQTGIKVAPRYDIESSKSVGLAGRLEAERDHPNADVWWGNEAFLTVRLADEGLLEAYTPPTADDVPPEFRDPHGFWTGAGVRARVLAVGSPAPAFEVKSIWDLTDPRLRDKIAIARPTAGSTGSHMAALYVLWGQDRAREFCHKLHDNGVTLLGGNAEVADQVGAGTYSLGLTDNDDVANTASNGGKISLIVPDQDAEGTLAMPTTIALVKSAQHSDKAKKLIDYLVSKEGEQKLIDLKFTRWSVRGKGTEGIKAVKIDYREAAKTYPFAVREATQILEGR
jgi:iron(III) transport system substrate-binding protein